MNNKLLKIINYYGVKPQLKYMQTEMYELIEAILDFENCNDSYNEDYDDKELFVDKLQKLRGHIGEEIADMQVMLSQVQEHYLISDEYIESIKEQKVDRQLKRIEEENKTNAFENAYIRSLKEIIYKLHNNVELSTPEMLTLKHSIEEIEEENEIFKNKR